MGSIGLLGASRLAQSSRACRFALRAAQSPILRPLVARAPVLRHGLAMRYLPYILALSVLQPACSTTRRVYRTTHVWLVPCDMPDKSAEGI